MIAFINQIFHRSLIVIINQTSIIITIPYLANIFSYESFAIFSQAIVFIQITWILSEWGIGNYSINIFPKSKNFQFKLFIEINYLVLLLLLAISACLFLIITFMSTNIDSKLFYILLFSFIFGGLNPLWFFQAQLRPKVLILPTLLSRLVFVLFIFLFVKNDQDIYLYFILNGLIFFFIFFYSLIILIREGLKFYYVPLPIIFNHFKSSFNFFISSLLGNQFASIWMFFFTLYSSPYLISIYAIGDHFLRAINTVSNIVANVIWANFKKNLIAVLKLHLISFLIFLSIPIGWILIKPLIMFFFNESFYESILICRILLIVWGLNFIFKIYMYPLFSKINSVDWVNFTIIKFGLLQLLAIGVWVLFLKNIWAMMTIMILILSLQLIYFSYKYLRKKY